MQKALDENCLKNDLYKLIKKDDTLLESTEEGSLGGVWYWNIETIENEWLSPIYWNISGYDSEDMKHKSLEFQDIIDSNDFKQVTEIFEKHLKNSNQPFDQTIRHKHENGSTVWIRCRGISTIDVNDQATRLSGEHINIDNSRQKQAIFEEMEKEALVDELIIVNKELAIQSDEKKKRKAELVIANANLVIQIKAKAKRAAELVIANKELAFQNKVKEKRAAELILANEELAFQSEEKEKRAAELILANKELAFQSEEKEKRAAELILANKELAFQSEEKEKRAAELILANKELVFQSVEKEKRAMELILANKELAFQNKENKKLAVKLIHANKKISIENKRNEYLGYHDYLTNLYNRRYFVNAFNTYTSKSYTSHGLMMIDINGLKIINDAYGHVRGNEAIRLVADLLLKVFYRTEVVARIGGDEFAILAPNKSDKQLQNYKDKLILLSQDMKIEKIPVSLAIGYEIITDNDRDIDDLLSSAEKRLYRHKITVGGSVRNHAIQAILNTLTEKYKEEKIHSSHVSQLCRQIGTELGLSTEEVDVLELAGMYHDIGKISIPDAILNKPTKLTNEEYDIIKTHTQVGYQILRAADEYSGLAEYALSHHERWDGKGYPRGLKGKEIPLFSRIINVADSYEAMTADRPYHRGMSIDEAVIEIKRCTGSQFDPLIANLFLSKILQQN